MLKRLVCITALAVSTVSAINIAHAAPIFGNFGEPAWSRMWKYFEKRYGTVSSGDLVMVPPVAPNSAWDDRDGTLRLMEMYQWGDRIPSNSWQYSPNAGKRVSDGYQELLDIAQNIIWAGGGMTPEQREALRRVSEPLDTARKLLRKDEDYCDASYAEHVRTKPPKERLTKKEFFRQQKCDVQIEADQKLVGTNAAAYAKALKDINNPDQKLLGRAILKHANPKQKISLPPVRELVGRTDLYERHYTSFIDGDIDAFMREKTPETENITESESQSDFYEQHWKASVSVSFLGLFRTGGADAEQLKREQHVKNNTTKIDISFANVKTFNIQRGEWYDQQVVDRFATLLTRPSFDQMFGQGGALELVPKSLLVGRGMKFSIYADSDSLDYLLETFHAGADVGFFIGWFRVGGDGQYNSRKESIRTYRISDHIDFVDLSGRGKVIGVLAQYLAGRIPRPAAAPLTAAITDADVSEIQKLWGEGATLEKYTKDMAPAEIDDISGSP